MMGERGQNLNVSMETNPLQAIWFIFESKAKHTAVSRRREEAPPVLYHL